MAQLTTTKSPSFLILATAPLPSTLPTATQGVATISGIVEATGTPALTPHVTLSSFTHSIATAVPTVSSSVSHTNPTILPSGAIIGIAIGVAVLTFLLVLSVILCTRRRRHMQQRRHRPAPAWNEHNSEKSYYKTTSRQKRPTLAEMAQKLHHQQRSQEPFDFNLPPSISISPPTAYKHISKALPRPPTPTPTPSPLEHLRFPLPAYRNPGTRMYDDDEDDYEAGHGHRSIAPPCYDESIYSEIRASNATDVTMTWGQNSRV